MTEITLQLPVPFIEHQVNDSLIPQRIADGYINATLMCQASGKLFADYQRLKNTTAYLEELSADMGIPISELVQVVRGGSPLQQGTWVHPQVAINLGQWLSPKFAVLVAKWFYEWTSGNIKPRVELPYHIRRYIANKSEVPFTHFSILNELIFGLIAPLEGQGYSLPESLMPDISQGKMFSNWLRKEKGVEPKDFPTYSHRFEDGRVVQARLYPNHLLADFKTHFNTVWIPQRAVSYFTEKDIKALPFLPKLLATIEREAGNLVAVGFDKAISKAAPPVPVPSRTSV